MNLGESDAGLFRRGRKVGTHPQANFSILCSLAIIRMFTSSQYTVVKCSAPQKFRHFVAALKKRPPKLTPAMGFDFLGCAVAPMLEQLHRGCIPVEGVVLSRRK